MRDGILISSVCTFSLPNGLCLFQGERPGQGQGHGAYQPPLQAQHRDPYLYPDLPGEMDIFDDDGDVQARNMAHDPGAAGIPAAAAGIFLSSPNL